MNPVPQNQTVINLAAFSLKKKCHTNGFVCDAAGLNQNVARGVSSTLIRVHSVSEGNHERTSKCLSCYKNRRKKRCKNN